MIEVYLSLISVLLTSITALFMFLKLRQTENKIWSIFEEFKNIVTFDKEGVPMVEPKVLSIINAIGSRMAISIKQSIFQGMGIDSKLSKSVDKALGSDMMNGSGIGGILDLLGMHDTKKLLAKNPRTLKLIYDRVAPLLNKVDLKATIGGGLNPNNIIPPKSNVRQNLNRRDGGKF